MKELHEEKTHCTQSQLQKDLCHSKMDENNTILSLCLAKQEAVSIENSSKTCPHLAMKQISQVLTLL